MVVFFFCLREHFFEFILWEAGPGSEQGGIWSTMGYSIYLTLFLVLAVRDSKDQEAYIYGVYNGVLLPGRDIFIC